MQRALRTAELAGFAQPQVTDLLKEVNYGAYEGLTSTQIHESDAEWELYSDGCPGGETPAQIYARARAFIDLVTQPRQGRVLAFAHGHILRAIAAAWIAADIGLAARLQLDVASINILRANGERGRLVALWNAT
jgi:broad specificity phosphatase PhoE